MHHSKTRSHLRRTHRWTQMNHKDEPRAWDEQAIRNSAPNTNYDGLRISPTTLHCTLWWLAFFAFLWMEEPPSCFVLYSQLHSTPTYLTHCIHSPFTVSHTVKRFLSQVRNLMVSCGMHAGPLFFLIPVQKQGQHCKFVWMTWHSHSTVQLSFHLWGEAEFTQLSLSFHPHPYAWIQMGWCCDFRRRQQYHPWIQTGP